MKLFLILVSVCLGWYMPVWCAHSLHPSDFRLQRAAAGPFRAGTLYRIHLTGEILHEMSWNLSDIRVFTQDGTPVPCVIVATGQPRPHNAPISLTITDFREEGHCTTVLAEWPDHPVAPISQLHFEVPRTRFSVRVSVEGQNRSGEWKVLGSGSIYDYSDRVPLRKTTIDLEPEPVRQYRIKMTRELQDSAREALELEYGDLRFRSTGITLDPISITGITGQPCNTGTDAVVETWSLTDFTAREGQRNETILTFETGVPAEKVGIETATRWFRRSASLAIQRPSDVNMSRILARGEFYRFPLHGGEENNLLLPVGEKLGLRYILTLKNGANPPLTVSCIQLKWHRRDLFFVTDRDLDGLRIVYGNTAVDPLRYDLSRIVTEENWRQLDSRLVQAGPILVSTEKPMNPTADMNQVHRTILIAAILAIVALLSIWALRMIRGKPDKPQSE